MIVDQIRNDLLHHTQESSVGKIINWHIALRYGTLYL